MKRLQMTLLLLTSLWMMSNPAQAQQALLRTDFVQRSITTASGTAIPLAPDRYEFAFGTSGSGNGQFNLPVGVAVDTLGNIWAVDRTNGTIQKFDKDGTYLLTATPPVSLTTIENIATDSSDNIYVVDSGTDAVYKFNSAGVHQATSAASLNNPIDAVIVGSTVYVLDNGKLYTLDSNLANPVTLVSLGLGTPQGIAASSGGALYVTDTSTDSVLQYSSGGVLGTSFALTNNDPRGIAIDQDTGTIYVTDTVAHVIEMISPDGASIGTIASIGSSLGEVSAPFDIALSSDNYHLVVADSGNDRIQVFCDGLCNIYFSDTDSNVNPDMKLNAYGFPVVTYYNGIDTSLHLAFCGDVRCDELEDYEVDNSADVGLQSSLGFSSDYKPVAAYYDRTNGALKLAKCDERNSCASPTIITVDTSGTDITGWNPALALNGDTAYIAYYNETTDTMNVISCDVSTMTCGSATALDTTTSYPHPDIVINDAGFPSIAYEDWTSGTASTLRLIYCTIATCSIFPTNIVDSSSTLVFYPALTLNSSNNPVIAYMGGAPSAGLYLATCADTACSSGTTINQVASGGTGFFADVKITSDSSFPVISYHNTTNYNLDLAECNNATCSSATISTLDSRYNTGRVTSLELDSNDEPIIAYFNNPEFDLRLYLPRDTAECFVRNEDTGLESRSLGHGAVQWVHDHSTTVDTNTLLVAGECTGATDWDNDGFKETLNLSKSLTLTGGYNPDSGQGDPDWSSSDPDTYETILQPATTNSTINQGRVVYVDASTAILESITFRNGNVNDSGGGIYITSTTSLTLDNSKVQSSISLGGNGGGIYDEGTLTIQNGSLIGGTQGSTGNQANAIGAPGGGLYIDSVNPTVIDASTISGNLANTNTNAQGGGIYKIGTGSLTVQNGSVIGGSQGTTGNTSGNGGGIAQVQGTVTIDASTISGNIGTDSTGGGGIMSFAPLNVQNGSVIGGLQGTTGNATEGAGGAILAGDTTLIDNSSMIGNIATYGGGGIAIYSPASVTIQNGSVIGGNSVTAIGGQGGGIYISTNNATTITDSTISGNTLTNTLFVQGGGIYKTNTGSLSLTNVTLSSNASSAEGGGLYTSNGTTSLSYVTVTNNTTSDDTTDGIYRGGGTLNVQNSIIAYNGDATDNVGTNNCSGTFTDSGGNYTNTGSDCSFSNATDSTLSLGSLTDNGGSTETHALLAGTAIDGGGASSVCPSTDQRGTSRPIDGDGDSTATCDAGAYEAASLYNCFAQEGSNEYASTDHRAVQEAVNAASAGATIKVAGTCTGVSNEDTNSAYETLYLNKDITLIGGYKVEGGVPDWTTNDPSLYETILQPATDNSTSDQGRVVYIASGTVLLEGITFRNGNSSDRGAGIYVPTSGVNLTLDNSKVQSSISASSLYGGGAIYKLGTSTLIIQNGSLIGGTQGSTGNTASAGRGGGIYLAGSGNTTITNSTVSGNTASTLGGGIYKQGTGSLDISNSLIGGEQGTTGNVSTSTDGAGLGLLDTGTVTIDTSIVSGNAAGRRGGAIYSQATLIITDSLIGGTQGTTGNTASGTDADGGGIYINSTLTTSISSTTISGNTATNGTGAQGGGLAKIATGSFDLTNVTISNNAASADGGGLYMTGGTVTLSYVTIANNTTSTDSDDGIYRSGGALTVQNSIIAYNGDTTDNVGTNNCSGTMTDSGGNYTNTGSDCAFTVDGSLSLGALTDNGGTTETHKLIAGNAIDGAESTSTCPTTDQRGTARPASVSECDAGAYENDPAPTCFVEANGDSFTDYSSSDHTAIQAAVNAATAGDTLKIAGTCTGVSSGNGSGSKETVYLNKNLTLIGGYNPNGTSPDWTTSDPASYETILQPATSNTTSNQGRVVWVEGSTSTNVTLTGITFRNGNVATSNGGGIYLEGGASLTLDNSKVQSSISGSGGGIYSQGALTIQNASLIGGTQGSTGNSSTNGGGGILAASGSLSISNSTISGNKAISNGAGIYTLIGITISDSTIGGIQGSTGNSLTGNSVSGGGIVFGGNDNSSISNSIISGNLTTATIFNRGGGIFKEGTGQLSIDAGSTIGGSLSAGTGNAAYHGGGIYVSQGDLIIDASTVSGNESYNVISADGGGGIVHTGSGTTSLTNVTLSANLAAGYAGAIYISNGTVNLSYVTMANNVATNTTSDGFYQNSGTLNVQNSIIAYNGNASDNVGTNNCSVSSGTFNDNGGNYTNASSTCNFSNADDSTLSLGALADNGGGVETHELLAGNAIDGADASSSCPSTDERGAARPATVSECDAGAYESAVSPFLVGPSLPGSSAESMLLSPLGQQTSSNLTYEWSAATDSSTYTLRVDGTGNPNADSIDSANHTVIDITLNAADICSRGICRYNPNVELAVGHYKWWVLPAGTQGIGQWSPPSQFRVVEAIPAPQPASPAGIINADNPTYLWYNDSSIHWYQLWIVETYTGTVVYNEWHKSRDICFGSACSVQPNVLLADGQRYEWWLQAERSQVYSTWTGPTYFFIDLANSDTTTLVPVPNQNNAVIQPVVMPTAIPPFDPNAVSGEPTPTPTAPPPPAEPLPGRGN